MFSYSGKPTGIVITTANHLKHPDGIENCTKLGQFILSKIITIVAPVCEILRRKLDFGWDSTPDPAGEAYRAPQTPS